MTTDAQRPFAFGVAFLATVWLGFSSFLLALPAWAAPDWQIAQQKAQNRLNEFAYLIFEPPLPGFKYRYSRINSKDLFKRFGIPQVRDVKLVPHRDPAPGKPTMIEQQTWHFRGMELVISAYPPSKNGKPAQIYIVQVEIDSSSHPLRFGLRVGKKLSDFVALLGEPNSRDGNKITYFSDEVRREASAEYPDVAYEITLILDGEERVKSIRWEWGGC